MAADDYIIPHTGAHTSKSAIEIVNRAFQNDEPVFVVRAKDVHSVRAIAAYLQSARGGASGAEYIEEIEKIYEAFLSWQRTHANQVKFPD